MFSRQITRQFTVAALVSLLSLAGLSPAALVFAQSANLTRVWDTKDTSQNGQLSIYNVDSEGSLLGMPIGCGDLNGDGFDDPVLAPFYGPAGATNNRRAAGKLHIVFGSEGCLDGRTINAASPPPNYVEVWGARPDDFLGNEVSVEDVTGDGIGDLLAGAQNADGFDDDTGRTQAGVLYIIKGRTTWTGPINLSNPGPDEIQVLGAHPGDRLGFWMVGGDVTGDGVADVLVSADLAKSSSGSGFNRGILYIIPGRPDFPARIDLADPSDIRDLDITTIYGIDDNDHFGSAIASGDFDGDGIGDVAVSAGVSRAGAAYTGYGMFNNGIGQGGGDGPNNDRSDSGEVYVLYGRPSWPSTIQMSSPPGDVAIYYGDQTNAFFGEDVRAADVDGDGRDDLGVGALLGDAPGRPNSGIGYVIWGGNMTRGERLDLRNASGTRFTKIYGEHANDIGADSILLADLDKDGLADVLFGSPTNTPAGRSTAGDLKVIFGSSSRFPAVIDTADPPVSAPVFQIVAPDAGDMFTYSLSVGDVDGDGYLDAVPNAMGGDGFGNLQDACGDAYVISGRLFAERCGRGTGSAPVLSRVEVTPDMKKYYAGQAGITLTLVCDSGNPSEQFAPGAVAVLRGFEVPTERVSANVLTVSLDAAPNVLNAKGSLVVQARNPNSGLSGAVVSVTLLGPSIVKLKAKRGASATTLTFKGKSYLPDVGVEVVDANGAGVEVLSVNRIDSKNLKATISTDVASGTLLTVRLFNPGPAYSDPANVVVP